MDASCKLSLECSSEKGDSIFEPFLEDCGTMSLIVSALTSVNFCSSTPRSLRHALEFISTIYLFPLHITVMFSILSMSSMLYTE
uniref:Uncharacterized protein LOC105640877 n=1 Tax=Rhizophora mucronata TaxID=61149 RepID=A0A2P2L007_RHIMU